MTKSLAQSAREVLSGKITEAVDNAETLKPGSKFKEPMHHLKDNPSDVPVEAPDAIGDAPVKLGDKNPDGVTVKKDKSKSSQSNPGEPFAVGKNNVPAKPEDGTQDYEPETNDGEKFGVGKGNVPPKFSKAINEDELEALVAEMIQDGLTEEEIHEELDSLFEKKFYDDEDDDEDDDRAKKKAREMARRNAKLNKKASRDSSYEPEDTDEEVEVTTEDLEALVSEMIQDGLTEDEIHEELDSLFEESDDLDEEEINELSKKTLGSYIKRAIDNRDSHWYQGDILHNYGHNKEGDKHFKKGHNRENGIYKAIGKLTKEDQELPIEIDMTEDVNALFNGETLSDDFKAKATAIFEGAVKSKLVSYQNSLDEAFTSALEEAVEEISEGLEEKVEEHLNYITEKWLVDNEVAIESSLRTELTEDFIAGLKNLFAENYIDIPEEKVDILEELSEQVEELTERLNEEISNNVELRSVISEAHKDIVLTDIVSGLPETSKEKIISLAENIIFTNEDDFRNKVKTIKESYLNNTKSDSSMLTEAEENNDDPGYVSENNSSMARAIKMLNRLPPQS